MRAFLEETFSPWLKGKPKGHQPVWGFPLFGDEPKRRQGMHGLFWEFSTTGDQDSHLGSPDHVGNPGSLFAKPRGSCCNRALAPKWLTLLWWLNRPHMSPTYTQGNEYGFKILPDI